MQEGAVPASQLGKGSPCRTWEGFFGGGYFRWSKEQIFWGCCISYDLLNCVSVNWLSKQLIIVEDKTITFTKTFERRKSIGFG